MSDDLFKDYVPVVKEYNEEVDGSDEHMIRETHLNTKESLLDKITKKKANNKGNKSNFRQPIRTENLED